MEGTALKEATLGGGCFWCVEAVYQELNGVESVRSGFCGGHVKDPGYEQVCTEDTGHAEVCRIVYDPKIITFDELLEVFFRVHDPTTLNKQGVDEGPQYRSVIFYHDEEQKGLAEKYIGELNEAGVWPNPIVTEVSPVSTFYPAEEYHNNYFNNNEKNNEYCSLVIRPKVEKFRKVFAKKLKDVPEGEKGL